MKSPAIFPVPGRRQLLAVARLGLLPDLEVGRWGESGAGGSRGDGVRLCNRGECGRGGGAEPDGDEGGRRRWLKEGSADGLEGEERPTGVGSSTIPSPGVCCFSGGSRAARPARKAAAAAARTPRRSALFWRFELRGSVLECGSIKLPLFWGWMQDKGPPFQAPAFAAFQMAARAAGASRKAAAAAARTPRRSALSWRFELRGSVWGTSASWLRLAF
jgi:hypothetical protein